MSACAPAMARPEHAPVPVLVVGLPELGAVLAAHPDLCVISAGRGMPLREALELRPPVNASHPSPGVIVATAGSDPDIDDAASALVHRGLPVIVLNGLDGGREVTDRRVPSLTVPFSPDDVLGLIRSLSGAGAHLRPVGDRRADDPEPERARPALEATGEVTAWAGPDPEATGWNRPPAPPPGGVSWGPPAQPEPALLGPPEPVPPWVREEASWAEAPESRDRRRAGMPQVVAFACPKGGSGKTSLSLNYAAFLGAGLRERGRRVVWVDGNLQQADGARYLGADERSSRSIVDLVGRPEIDDRSVLASLTPPEATGQPVWALFGPMFKRDADPATVGPGLLREAVGVLRRHFDHIVVDTPVAEHYDGLFRDFVLAETDLLTVVVPPLLPVVRGVREWLEIQSQPVAAGGSAFPAERVMVVLNMDSRDSGCPVEVVRDSWLSRWSWAGVIPYDPAWTAATNDRRLMTERPAMADRFAELVLQTTGEVIEIGGRLGTRGLRGRPGLAGGLRGRPGPGRNKRRSPLHRHR